MSPTAFHFCNLAQTVKIMLMIFLILLKRKLL